MEQETRESLGHRPNGYTRRLFGQSADEKIVRAPLPLPGDEHKALPSEEWLKTQQNQDLPGLSEKPMAKHRYKELVDRALQSTCEARQVYKDEERRLKEDTEWRDARKAYLEREEEALINRINETEDLYKQREQDLKERRNSYWIDAVTCRAELGETFFTIHWGDRRIQSDGVSDSEEPGGVDGPDPDRSDLPQTDAGDDGVGSVSVATVTDVSPVPSDTTSTPAGTELSSVNNSIPAVDLSQYPARLPVELIDSSVGSETERQLNMRDFHAEAAQLVPGEDAIAAELNLLLNAPQKEEPSAHRNWWSRFAWTMVQDQHAWTQFSLLMCSLIFGLSLGMATGFINLGKLQNLQYNWSMLLLTLLFMVLGAGIFYVMGRVIDLFTHLWMKGHLNPSDPTAPGSMANRIRRLAVGFGILAICGVTVLVVTEVIVERQGIVKFIARQSLTGEAVSGFILWAMCLVVSLPFVLFHIADGLTRAGQEAMRTLVRQERARRIDLLAAQRRQEAYESTRQHVQVEMDRLRAERDRQHAERLEARRQEDERRRAEQWSTPPRDYPPSERISPPVPDDDERNDGDHQRHKQWAAPLKATILDLETRLSDTQTVLTQQIRDLEGQVGDLRAALKETDRREYHVESQRLMAHVVRLNQELKWLRVRRKQDLEPLRARLTLIQDQIRALATEQEEFHAASRQRQLDAYQTAIQSVHDLDAYTLELKQILEPLTHSKAPGGRNSEMRPLPGLRGWLAQLIAGRKIYEPVDAA